MLGGFAVVSTPGLGMRDIGGRGIFESVGAVLGFGSSFGRTVRGGAGGGSLWRMKSSTSAGMVACGSR
jgi:hypothetical protein